MFFCRVAVCTNFVIAWALIAVGSPVLAVATDLMAIQASLNSMRNGAGITRIKYSGKVRIVKGSMNDLLDQPRPRGTGPDVPNEDSVLETSMEEIRDFRRNRGWTKGSEAEFHIEKDAMGSDKVISYSRFTESAFDGVEGISISPKETRDPRSIPRGVKVPVEVYRFKLGEGGEDPTIAQTIYPIFLTEGCLPSPDQPLTPRRYLPPFEPQKWRVAGTAIIDGHECPILVSSPTSSGVYDEYALRPDLNHVPCRWVRYYKGDPTQVVTIQYQPLNEGRPKLDGWNIQIYRPKGVLFREETYKVVRVSHLDSVDDALFRLAPADGMVIFNLNDTEFRIAGNEAVRFDSNYEANEFLDRQTRWLSYLVWFVVGTIVVTGLGGAIYWARRRITK